MVPNVQSLRSVQVVQSRSSFIELADWQAEMASIFGLGCSWRQPGRRSWSKAIGGLEVDNEYRDGTQSTFVVCRNQLWNTYSVVFVFHNGPRLDVYASRPVVSFLS
jgi:hypothetical protein